MKINNCNEMWISSQKNRKVEVISLDSNVFKEDFNHIQFIGLFVSYYKKRREILISIWHLIIPRNCY